MYSEMLASCEDPELAQIIETLRNSERAPGEMLLERYVALRKARAG